MLRRSGDALRRRWIARKFVTDLKQSATGHLAAVGARRLEDAQKFAADFGGANAHGSYQALLDDPAVEAVYIGTPHPGHAEWAIKAAEAGKHVLCEKPLTMNLADTERVLAAAKKHNVLLMEAYMYRFHPQTARLIGRTAPASEGMHVFGPAPAPLAMLRGRHRHRLLVHAARTFDVQNAIRTWLGALDWPKSVRVAVDVDPYSFL